MIQDSRHVTSQTPFCKSVSPAVASSQAEDEAVDLHHVRRFQKALQFAFSQPHERSARGCCGGAVGENGFEEEYLCSDRALRPHSFGQLVLVDSAGGVAEESRLETSSCKKRSCCEFMSVETTTEVLGSNRSKVASAACELVTTTKLFQLLI